MRFSLCVTLVTSIACAQCALANEPRFDAARLQKISSRMNDFIREGKIAGAVTLIATRDGIVHESASGKADIANNREMTTDTIFRIASMTKLVTATAMMMLVEQGKLGIDDPVSKYIPSFAGQKLKSGHAARAVTIRDVVTHTAGLAQPSGKESEGLSLQALVDLIGSKPLEFEPGAKWQYSSGLTVAGRLIEIVSETGYAEYLKQNIFEPLGMKDTTFRLSKDQAARLAVTYKPGKESGTLDVVEIPDPTAERTPGPSGGLYSTAKDMARFYRAILNRGSLDNVKLLSPATVQKMIGNHTPGITTGFTPGNCWGLGWCIVQQPQGVTRLHSRGTHGHGGAWGTQGWIDPARGLVCILMIQRSGFGNSDGSEIRDAFTELAVQAHRGIESETARFVSFHGYTKAVELTNGPAKVILCPQAGGRVLQFSVNGRDAMFLDDQEKAWQPGKPGPITAGRFDYGPELVTTPHSLLWSGEWTAEITSPHSACLVSQRDESAGIQLMREFELRTGRTKDESPCLLCTQTMMNISNQTREVCHWGRSFSPGGGICLIPLGDQPSRFPSKYAMYEDSAIINVRNKDDRIRERDGFLEILAPPRKPKLGFDSHAGWLGYLMPNDVLFVKRFATFPDRVYNEAAALTLSVWYPEGPRIELEPIGPRERLQPGETASFAEEWHLLSHAFPKKGDPIDLKSLRERVSRTLKDAE